MVTQAACRACGWVRPRPAFPSFVPGWLLSCCGRGQALSAACGRRPGPGRQGRSPCPGVPGLPLVPRASPWFPGALVWPVGGWPFAVLIARLPRGVPALHVFRSPCQSWTFVRPEVPPPHPSFGSAGPAPSPASSFGSLGSTPQSRDFPRGLGSAANSSLQSPALPCGPGVGVSGRRVSVCSEDAASDPVVLSPHTCLSCWQAGPSLTVPAPLTRRPLCGPPVAEMSVSSWKSGSTPAFTLAWARPTFCSLSPLQCLLKVHGFLHKNVHGKLSIRNSALSSRHVWVFV